MTEIYLDESRFVYLDITGAPTDTTPVAKIIRTGATDVTLAVQTVVPAPTGVTERWKAYIPLAEVDETGDFKVYWTGMVGGEAFDFVQYYSVVIPYAKPDQIAERLGWQFTDPSAPGYQDYDRVVAAEFIARTMINNYCQLKFSPVVRSIATKGTGRDMITLPDRVMSIRKIYEADTLIYDATQDPVFNYRGLDFVIADSGFGVRISGEYWDYNEFDEYVLVARNGRFVSDRRYEVQGYFGYESVPQEVFESAVLLVNDLMCQDAVYRIRYINHVQVKDWKFSYDQSAWVGTGNALADDLLSQYKVQPVWVI